MNRHSRRRAAKQRLQELLSQPDAVYIIHYACERFYERQTSPRVTSIAIRHLGTDSTESFSIQQIAEREGKLASIPERYDELERGMLQDYFQYLRQIRSGTNSLWIHWHMGDANYGFSALEHRARVLGLTPEVIPDRLKVDLPEILSDIYGEFAPHPRPKGLSLVNGITLLGFLSGAEEAAAAENGKFLQVKLSTLRKVNVIADILRREGSGQLKTTAPWQDRLRGWADEHRLKAAIAVVVGAVGLVGGVITIANSLVGLAS